MEKDKQLISAIMTAVVALGLISVSTSVRADDQTMEKCFGVVKAGQNDCDTNDATCTMKSMIDADPNYWVYLPKGVCAKLVGGVTKPSTTTGSTMNGSSMGSSTTSPAITPSSSSNTNTTTAPSSSMTR